MSTGMLHSKKLARNRWFHATLLRSIVGASYFLLCKIHLTSVQAECWLGFKGCLV